MTTPDPTVRLPSRIANRAPASSAIGFWSCTPSLVSSLGKVVPSNCELLPGHAEQIQRPFAAGFVAGETNVPPRLIGGDAVRPHIDDIDDGSYLLGRVIRMLAGDQLAWDLPLRIERLVAAPLFTAHHRVDVDPRPVVERADGSSARADELVISADPCSGKRTNEIIDKGFMETVEILFHFHIVIKRQGTRAAGK